MAGLAIAIWSSAMANTIIYDNLEATAGGFSWLVPGAPLGDSFTPTTTCEITDLQLALHWYGASAELTVGLYSGTRPVDLITTLGTIDISTTASGIQDFSVPLLAHPTVVAGTQYWIQATTLDWNVAWAWSSDTSGVGVAGEDWDFDGVINSTPGPYLMKLGVSPQVPDLTNTACVLALSVSSLFVSFNRKKPGYQRIPSSRA